MERRDRSGSVNDTGNSAAGAGWPAALTLTRQREATFKKQRRLHRQEKLCARARKKDAFERSSCERAHCATRR